MFKFLEAQKMDPKRKDWYSEVQDILEVFELKMTEEDITDISSTRYNNIVKKEGCDSRNKIPQK